MSRSDLADGAPDWAARLAEHADAFGVPGAVLGIDRDGERTVVAHGVLSTSTGVATTPDSVFQIGSITKLWTATMVLQLVDEGRLTLDSTVAQLLPGVRLGVDDVADQVTVRHLLTHTSGVDGDLFVDTGRGDDCIATYVDRLASAAQNHPVGAAYSYCNAGFVLLGRIVEVLDDTTWDAALRRRLVEPLGLTATVTLPEEALLHRAAVGHREHPRAAETMTTWGLMRSIGPAALITQSADDLLTFARLCLDGGATVDGSRLLSPESATVMLDEQVRLPEGNGRCDAVGLAWRIHEWDGRRLVGHDGSTVGQNAFLRIEPRSRVAVCLLTNSPESPALYRRIVSEVLEEYAGVRVPDPVEPVEVVPYRPERHAGRYERAAARFDIAADGAGLRVTSIPIGELAELRDDPEREYELLPLDGSGDRYAFREHDTQPWAPVTFDRFDDGTPYVFVAGRATPKV